MALMPSLMAEQGFVLDRRFSKNSDTAWFVSDSASSVRAALRFEVKPRMKVLTVHLGWQHEPSRRFCVDALRADWTEGYAWLFDVGILETPSLLTFNLVEYLAWPIGGIPLDIPSAEFVETAVNMLVAVQKNGWDRFDEGELLNTYISDHKPIHWRGSNCAIRIALIAGLLQATGGGWISLIAARRLIYRIYKQICLASEMQRSGSNLLKAE